MGGSLQCQCRFVPQHGSNVVKLAAKRCLPRDDGRCRVGGVLGFFRTSDAARLRGHDTLVGHPEHASQGCTPSNRGDGGYLEGRALPSMLLMEFLRQLGMRDDSEVRTIKAMVEEGV